MSPPLETVFLALSELTKKRGLLADDQIPKLLDLAKGGSVTDVDSLRSWVKSTPHLASGLRRELLRSLKAPRHRQMGSYHIIGHLADGGMGDVWLAADGHGRLAVVKTLLNELSSDTEFLLRFEREARITAQFTSRYLVRCLEHGQSEDGAMYIALEYVPGGDLHNLVCHRQYLSEEEALRITQHIALGLDDAADARLVHRDIKPENILISNEGDAKLVDFGLARSTSSDRTVLTMAGSTLGTPDYMSPEQIYGEDDLDVRSDLYALGAVLFFSLAGHPPFEGDNIEVMKQHISSRLPNIRRLNRSVGRTTQAIIEKCMEKEPVRRFQRPKELAKAVADALDTSAMTCTTRRCMASRPRTSCHR
jgi:serine/threonine-protein kinase